MTIPLFGVVTFAQAESKPLRYVLCKNIVAQARVVSSSNSFSVIIKLSQSATKDFSIITAKNVGRRLTIYVNDTVVTSAIIKAEINSGTIQSSRMTEGEAKNIQSRILNSIKEPCGLVKEGSET